MLLTFTYSCCSGQSDSTIVSQKKWIVFENDNDFLALGKVTDRYYTFGTLLGYSIQSKKVFQTAGIAMKGYTPTYRNNRLPDSLTRPFAGWSYLFYERTMWLNKLYLKAGLELGVLGSKSGAGDFQNLFHELGGDVGGNPQVEGWDNQIPNKVGINLTLDVNYFLFYMEQSNFYIGSENSLGNIFTYISPYISYQYSNNYTGSYFPIKYSTKIEKRLDYVLELRYGIRLPFHTAPLEGEYFGEQRYIDKEQINKTLLRADLIARFSYLKWSLYYGLTRYSEEIKKNEDHLYGTLGIIYTF